MSGTNDDLITSVTSKWGIQHPSIQREATSKLGQKLLGLSLLNGTQSSNELYNLLLTGSALPRDVRVIIAQTESPGTMQLNTSSLPLHQKMTARSINRNTHLTTLDGSLRERDEKPANWNLSTLPGPPQPCNPPPCPAAALSSRLAPCQTGEQATGGHVHTENVLYVGTYMCVCVVGCAGHARCVPMGSDPIC